jgi:hypothetical protein
MPGLANGMICVSIYTGMFELYTDTETFSSVMATVSVKLQICSGMNESMNG